MTEIAAGMAGELLCVAGLMVPLLLATGAQSAEDGVTSDKSVGISGTLGDLGIGIGIGIVVASQDWRRPQAGDWGKTTVVGSPKVSAIETGLGKSTTLRGCRSFSVSAA